MENFFELGRWPAGVPRGPWRSGTDPQYRPDHVFIHGGPSGKTLIAEVNYIVRHGVDKPRDPHATGKMLSALPDLIEACQKLVNVRVGHSVAEAMELATSALKKAGFESGSSSHAKPCGFPGCGICKDAGLT